MRLIKKCMSKPFAQLEIIHDPVSADDINYPKRYIKQNIDCVFSNGLLYHLSNPYQHLTNLFAITNKYAVIYTMTHQNYFAQNKWTLTLEDPKWITKATSGISWTPFFLELPKLLKKVGFKNVKIVYPEIFEKNFQVPELATNASAFKWIFEIALQRSIGLRVGQQKNTKQEYFINSGLNPNYFAYICEK